MTPLLLLTLAALLALLHKAFELVLTNEYATWAPGLARLLARAAGFICRPQRSQWWADLCFVQREEKASGLLQAGWCFLSSPALALRHAVARLRSPRRQLAGAPLIEEGAGMLDAMGAALARSLGSMWTVYVTLAFLLGWIALGTWGPLRRVDPYPFSFLLFLDNVLFTTICFVILVGQRVVIRAADRQSRQAYENSSTLFRQLTEVQTRLDRHDVLLTRDHARHESRPHPWVAQHDVQAPPVAADQLGGVNGRIAGWITVRLGSMWALAAAVALQLLWIGLAQVNVQRFDRYPYPFMSFLSTVFTLVLLIVVVVGQDVIGRSGDRRSERAFLNADAMLHEVRRIQERLADQERYFEHLTGGDRPTATE